ncbi:hypothetical protein PMA4326_001530 [Pseudomonas syringae pv. maculicola str. ES4326]|uniref:Uncharacterized protein n=1 Tax=Pseudomonas syringae pv. maculicola str. ES4326 TaxID=629265 RepID=A0A8T8BWT6_PSEYM|nr:hypothetical protein PMA4326_001530 [Pseudomonas syringae pv. maculicola str. ES4326]
MRQLQATSLKLQKIMIAGHSRTAVNWRLEADR